VEEKRGIKASISWDSRTAQEVSGGGGDTGPVQLTPCLGMWGRGVAGAEISTRGGGG
jgi:hypothetical protein